MSVVADPRAVGWLNATRVEARSVALAWARPAGVYSDFEVQYLQAADSLQTHVTARQDLTLSDLRPHTLYTFTVVVSERERERERFKAPHCVPFLEITYFKISIT